MGRLLHQDTVAISLKKMTAGIQGRGATMLYTHLSRQRAVGQCCVTEHYQMSAERQIVTLELTLVGQRVCRSYDGRLCLWMIPLI